MKIIQVISHLSGGGLTKYIFELHKGLKKAGHNAIIYRFLKDSEFNDSTIIPSNITLLDKNINEETINELNNADIVFLNGICLKKHPDEFKLNFINMIKNLKTKTVLFNNAHRWRSIISNYGDLFLDKDFINSFDKIACFSEDCEFFEKMIQLYGEDIRKKYVHLQLPYEFDETKSLWKDFSIKKPRITYFGRPVAIKSPERILEMHPYLLKHGFEGEMRGISRGIGVVTIPNLIYKFVDGKQTKEKSDITFFVSNKWKVSQSLDKSDNLLNYDKRNGKVFVFGPYDNKEGMEMISYSMFACDFYHLPKHKYGDTLEYAMYDIVDSGTILVLDTGMGKVVKANENGLPTKNSLHDLNAGLFVNDDLSNIDDFINKIKNITSSLKKYEEFRQNQFEIYKKHADPLKIAAQLIKELLE